MLWSLKVDSVSCLVLGQVSQLEFFQDEKYLSMLEFKNICINQGPIEYITLPENIKISKLSLLIRFDPDSKSFVLKSFNEKSILFNEKTLSY